MTYCEFNRTSTENIITGSWSPFAPDYHPFADVDEFCSPCYRWRFLQLIRGSFPRWEAMLRNPRDVTADFPQYYKVSSCYKDFATIIMRALSRSLHPDNIIRSLGQSGNIIDEIRGNTDIQPFHIFAMDLVVTWLQRLENEHVLDSYISNENTLYNLMIINENFDLFRNDNSIIQLETRRQAGVGVVNQRTPQTFYWRGPISIYGAIPIINLETQQIRVPVPVADNFFDPPVDLSDQMSPEGIKLFFITKEFHKMWILRESLSQLLDHQILRMTLQDGLGNNIFNSFLNIDGYNFRDFEIIVDTIDHSISMDPNLSFRDETGHAAIIFDLLYRPYPNLVNSFQDIDPCPIQLGQDPARSYRCPLGGTQGCHMGDRRITRLQFPRDRIERNVYRFLRLLRDEAVFEHEVLYKITRLHPERLDELNQFSYFWIGELYQDNMQRWIFRLNIPQYWIPPQITRKRYDVSLISPVCFELGYKISFISRLNQNEFEVLPIVSSTHSKMNPWMQVSPFNTSNPIQCIIGELSSDDNLMNINRQKRQLVRAIHYSYQSVRNVPDAEKPNLILARRLNARDKRAGMATFGRYARYV